MDSRFKIFSDPVHGFISVPKNVLLGLIESPEVQRLRRIRQLGVGHLVFPGAEHSRFGHALGAMALMHDALLTLADKGTPISPAEHTAALAAALLHDIGHGPFSHTLEHDLLSGVPHEAVSRALLVSLDARFGGALGLTLRMFDGTYERPFFHQLVSGELDVDRLDYLRRDSFYTGVVEGEVGVQRLIKTLRVEPTAGGPESRLVVESKGIYAIENFLLSRRLMYAQVYLHKTVLAGDHVLQAALRRVRRHVEKGTATSADRCSAPLLFFLTRRIQASDLSDSDVQRAFCALDDTDVLVSLKRWMDDDDRILADLAERFINRRLPAVTFVSESPDASAQAHWYEKTAAWLVREGLSTPASAVEDARYYVAFDQTRTGPHVSTGGITIRTRDGALQDFSDVTEYSAASATVRPFIVHPKEVEG